MMTITRERVFARVKQNWLSWALVTFVAASVLDSCINTPWYADTAPLILAALGGLIHGGLLATTRFRSTIIAIVSGLTSILVAVLTVGRLIPVPGVLLNTPLPQSLSLMNLRLLMLIDALAHSPMDLRWLAILFGVLVWNAGARLTWCIARRTSALSGIVLCAIPLAINIIAVGKEASWPMVFLTASVLLLVRTAYVSRLREWDKRRVGYPELIGDDWAVSAALVAAGVLLIAGVTTPEWRNTLQHFLDSLRPKVVVQQPPIQFNAPSVDSTVTAFVPNLTVVGQPIPPSTTETLFYVQVDDPSAGIGEGGLPLPPEQRHYWRADIFTHYTGAGWEAGTLRDETTQIDSSDAIPPGRYALTQRFELVALHADRLFGVNDPIRTDDATLRRLTTDDSAIVQGIASQYRLVSWAARATASELAADNTDYPALIRDTYLQVPDRLPARVRDLAARLIAPSDTPYDKAIRIQNYLRATYPYRLDVPLPPPGRDVVDYFLFDAPGGFCSYYASAMAVMLRTVGVPARVATGYATGDFDMRRQSFVVTEAQAHAWVEVYFPTYGWIDFEPTASLAPFEYRDLTQPQAEAPSSQPFVIALPDSSQIGWLGAGLIGLLLIGALVTIRRQRAMQRRPIDQQARGLYWQMRRSLIRLGLRAPAHLTPDEFLSHYAGVLAARPQLSDAVQRITHLYVAAIFTQRLPSLADVRRSHAAWNHARIDRFLLRLRALAQSFALDAKKPVSAAHQTPPPPHLL